MGVLDLVGLAGLSGIIDLGQKQYIVAGLFPVFYKSRQSQNPSHSCLEYCDLTPSV
jgi:hypothetical protein